MIKWLNKTTYLREKKQAKIFISTTLFSLIFGSILEIIMPLNDILIFPGITTIIALVPFYGLWYSSEKLGMMNFKEEDLAIDVLKMMDEGLMKVH